MLESAHDAFVAIDRDGRDRRLERRLRAPVRLVGAGGARQADLRRPDLPARGARGAHAPRRNQLAADRPPVADLRHELELQRQDGTRFPAEEAISRVAARRRRGGLASSATSPIERRRDEEEREALLREQAARAEAERVAEMVARHAAAGRRRARPPQLDDILRDLVPRVRGVLDADEAAIFLTEEDGTLTMRGVGRADAGGEPPIAFGEGFAGRVAAAQRSPLLVERPRRPTTRSALPAPPSTSLIGVPLLAGGARDRRDPGGDERRRAGSATRTSACCGWPPTASRSRSTTRASTSASTGSPRRSSAACCPSGCRSCPGSPRRRATCRPRPRPRSAATGTT